MVGAQITDNIIVCSLVKIDSGYSTAIWLTAIEGVRKIRIYEFIAVGFNCNGRERYRKWRHNAKNPKREYADAEECRRQVKDT